jgi:phosphinothricin acetyltransferase
MNDRWYYGVVHIVDAEPEHLPAIAAIYAAEVETSPSTFDLEVPPIEYWERALAAVDPAAGHFLIVGLDDGGTVLGYAKSGRFRDRAAYDASVETSIYIAGPARGRGVGTALYARLIELLETSEARVAVGVMTEPNPASTALHESLGFSVVGTFEGVGVKFGQPLDVTWFRRAV